MICKNDATCFTNKKALPACTTMSSKWRTQRYVIKEKWCFLRNVSKILKNVPQKPKMTIFLEKKCWHQQKAKNTRKVCMNYFTKLYFFTNNNLYIQKLVGLSIYLLIKNVFYKVILIMTSRNNRILDLFLLHTSIIIST